VRSTLIRHNGRTAEGRGIEGKLRLHCERLRPHESEQSDHRSPANIRVFLRILAKYVREDRAVSLESAVRAMSSLPANILQLTDRGRIVPGMAADIVVFDPLLVQDVSTFEQPLAYPKGIDYVLVNGRVAVNAGQVTGLQSGRVLRHLTAIYHRYVSGLCLGDGNPESQETQARH
jgi:N-acyl-D-aspartate/D-glutamate deacylase